MPNPIPSVVPAVSLALLLLLAACSGDAVVQIEETREVARSDLRLGLSAEERFGYNRQESRADPSELFTWDLPDGWEQRPPTEFRIGNFALPGDAECTLSVVGGGLRDNLNRWRQQMGLDPWTEDQVAQLERRELLGRPATYVEIEGDYTGMDGRRDAAAKMVGYVLPMPPIGGSLFVKAVGTRAAIDAELDGIAGFARSVRPGPGLRARRGDSGSDAIGDAGSRDRGDAQVGGAEGLTWTVPAEWERAPDRSMRLVNLRPRGDGAAECWISVLGGDGGGLAQNVGRWFGQVGLPPPEAAEIEALPEVSVLGRRSKIVEVASGSQTLMAVACFLDDRSIFVKMIGPTDEVRGERERFVAFCESLRL